jgi:hypothetical protein
VPLVARWADGKPQDAWLFAAPGGGPLNEGKWKRSVRWPQALEAIKRPRLRVHDLRHTAASLWLAAGADPKVVQRILGHASAAMTMDLYGHLIDRNLWEAAARVGEVSGESGASGGTSGARTTAQAERRGPSGTRNPLLTCSFASEPVTGVEPATSSLQVRRSTN